MDEIYYNYKCIVNFTIDREQYYFLVKAATKVQAIELVLEHLIVKSFLTNDLSGIRVYVVKKISSIIQVSR